MNKVKVRCWKVKSYSRSTGVPDILYITYPEDNSGHNLITCINCGAIYAITVVKEVYVGPPLEQKIKRLNCSICGQPLENNYAFYPATYILNGRKYSFQRPEEIPPDDESIVKEFEGIYE